MFRRLAAWVAAPFLAASIAYVAVILASQPRIGPLSKPSERKQAEDFVLLTLDDHQWALSAVRGQVVVLNFWSTSCPPCVRETPALIRVESRFRTSGVKLVGICVDPEEDEGAIREMVERLHISYPVLRYRRGGELSHLAVHLPVLLDSVPVTVLIDRRGRIARVHYGAVTERLLQRDIERLLNESP